MHDSDILLFHCFAGSQKEVEEEEIIVVKAKEQHKVEELTAAEVKKMTVAQLKAELETRGAETTGLKAVLQQRLLATLWMSLCVHIDS